MDSFTIEAFSQDDAAEAIQGLQALAQRGVLETGAIIEEQVQVGFCISIVLCIELVFRHGIFPPIGGFPSIERSHRSLLRSVQKR